MFFCQKNSKLKTVIRENECKELLNQKGAHKMLMKLIPRANFIIVLRVAFALEDAKSTKKTDNLTAFLLYWDLCTQKLLVEL
jgi:hypothetical protein